MVGTNLEENTLIERLRTMTDETRQDAPIDFSNMNDPRTQEWFLRDALCFRLAYMPASVRYGRSDGSKALRRLVDGLTEEARKDLLKEINDANFARMIEVMDVKAHWQVRISFVGDEDAAEYTFDSEAEARKFHADTKARLAAREATRTYLRPGFEQMIKDVERASKLWDENDQEASRNALWHVELAVEDAERRGYEVKEKP
jgi:hypothetical protein